MNEKGSKLLAPRHHQVSASVDNLNKEDLQRKVDALKRHLNEYGAV